MKLYSLLLIGATQAIHGDGDGKLVASGLTASNGHWIPDRYSTDDDDQLMKNLIEKGLGYTKDKGFSSKYPFQTTEGCNASEQACLCCMQKHTHYWVDRAGAYDAAKEIVGVNLHMEPSKVQEFLDLNFDTVWKKQDVLGTGWVEVERMSSFYKELMGDVTISIQ